MTTLAQRKATVYVGNLKLEGFRVAFTVKKSLESATNGAQCSIYALNESSRSGLETARKPPFIIDAGYEELSGVIFSGEALRPNSTKTPTGWVTNVQAADGHSAQRALVNLTMGKGTTVGQVIEKLAGSMGVAAKGAIDKAKSGAFDGALKKFEGGLTLTGSAKSHMDKLTGSLGLEWSIQDGELVILQAQEVRPGLAVKLSSSTGLLGAPELVLDAARPGKRIVRLKSLLNPRLNPGVKVSVESEVASGIFKVTQVTHTGDTFGSNWTSTLEAVELTGLIAAS